MLSKTTSRSQEILYLLLYNFIFVSPFVQSWRQCISGKRQRQGLERWRSARLGKLLLISGVVMLLLGVGMIVAVLLGYM